MSFTSEFPAAASSMILAATEQAGPNLEESMVGSLVAILMVAAVVAIVVERIRLPYTVALAVIGLGLSWFRIAPAIEDLHLTHDIIFFVLLPPLLFQGSLHMDLSMLHRNVGRIALLALPGVLISTFVVGLLVALIWGIWDEPNGRTVGLLFGATVAATDPISVLAIFKEFKVPQRLRAIVEGESLFNDGTAVVVFSVILGFLTGEVSDFSILATVGRFVFVSLGGVATGLILGYIVYHIMQRLDDHLVEVTITIVLAYGSFWLAEEFPLHPTGMHLSGVLATVTAGLFLGNVGTELTMSAKTRGTVLTFWEVVEFLVNSILFILIGVQMRQVWTLGLNIGLVAVWGAVLISLFGRALTVYGLMGVMEHVGRPMPYRWSHVFFWGGLRGSIPIALVLGLVADGGDPGIPHVRELKAAVFALVLFSTVVQGLTMKPLLNWLKIGETEEANP